MKRQTDLLITNKERAAICSKFLKDKDALNKMIDAAEDLAEIKRLDKRKKALTKRFKKAMQEINGKGMETR